MVYSGVVVSLLAVLAVACAAPVAESGPGDSEAAVVILPDVPTGSDPKDAQTIPHVNLVITPLTDQESERLQGENGIVDKPLDGSNTQDSVNRPKRHHQLLESLLNRAMNPFGNLNVSNKFLVQVQHVGGGVNGGGGSEGHQAASFK